MMIKIFENITKVAVTLLFVLSMTMSAATSFSGDDSAMNPCAKTNPCAKHNPCAKANPCAMNPCAANPCGGNPCSPPEAVEITNKEAIKIYKKLSPAMHIGYAKSGLRAAKEYYKWSRFNKSPYVSDTHGSRFVNNYSNRKRYGKYENSGTMKAGTILAKDSFLLSPSGKAEPGPLFLMEKMKAGYNKENGDWAYTLILPDGNIYGTSQGKDAENVTFCSDCHNAAEDQDYMFFLPEEYRK